ncbi:MBL fold metallo-hydrolase [Cryptosporangium minutisporangium]
MPQEKLTVSGISIESVPDGWAQAPPGTLLVPPSGSPADWETSGWFEPGGWRFPLGGFLLRTADRLILVDAGTHLHRDHVGWLSVDGEPTFPAAAHHVHAADWATLESGHGEADMGMADIVRPIGDLVRLARAERTEIAPGVLLRLVAGHTPGNCLIEVGEGEDRAFLLGDTAHHPATLVEDGWLDKFDADRDGARKARAQLADELEASGIPAVGAHFDGCRFGRVIRGRDGSRRWELVDLA